MFTWKCGAVIWIVFFYFGIIETGYFGWNFKPCCQAERVCDMIGTIGTSIGLGLILGDFFFVIIKKRKEG